VLVMELELVLGSTLEPGLGLTLERVLVEALAKESEIGLVKVLALMLAQRLEVMSESGLVKAWVTMLAHKWGLELVPELVSMLVHVMEQG